MFESLPPRVFFVEHGPRPSPHFGTARGIGGEIQDCRDQHVRVTDRHGNAALMLANDSAYFTVPIANHEDRAPSRGNAVKLAGHDEPLQLRAE